MKYRLKFLALASTIIIILAACFLIIPYIQQQNYNNLDKTITANWKDSSTATRDYKILQNAFNTQKNEIIKFYNSQVDKAIKDKFDPAEAEINNRNFQEKFTKYVMKNTDIKDDILTGSKHDKRLNSSFNNLCNKSKNKLGKISRIYNRKLQTLKTIIRMKKNVSFASLKEYDFSPKNIQLNEKDFTQTGTAIKIRNDKITVWLVCFVAEFFVIMFGFTIFMLLFTMD